MIHSTAVWPPHKLQLLFFASLPASLDESLRRPVIERHPTPTWRKPVETGLSAFSALRIAMSAIYAVGMRLEFLTGFAAAGLAQLLRDAERDHVIDPSFHQREASEQIDARQMKAGNWKHTGQPIPMAIGQQTLEFSRRH